MKQMASNPVTMKVSPSPRSANGVYLMRALTVDNCSPGVNPTIPYQEPIPYTVLSARL